MEEQFDFDFPEGSHKDKIQFAKITKRIVLFLLIAFVVLSVFRKFYNSISSNDGFIPVAKTPSEQIKVEHDITEDINVKNVDIEVYDQLNTNKKPEYNDIVIEEPKESDGFFAKIKSHKEDLKREKIEKQKEKLQEEEESIKELNEDLGNSALIRNIKAGKDTKPSIRAQLSASSSEMNAEEYWQDLNKQFPDMFKGLKHIIEANDFGERGKIYRLQVGYFETIAEAKSFCNRFILYSKKNATDCIVVKN